MLLRLLRQTAMRPCSRALLSEGSRMLSSRPMMATTTSSSISVNPWRRPERMYMAPVARKDRLKPSGSKTGPAEQRTEAPQCHLILSDKSRTFKEATPQTPVQFR